MTGSDKTLLTSQEKAICEQVSISKQQPHDKRAHALLAINAGLTQVNAGKQAGLTAGQVRYWLQRFRLLRCGIFPAELQTQSVTVQQIKSKPRLSPDKIKKRNKGKTKKRKQKKKMETQEKKRKDKKKNQKSKKPKKGKTKKNESKKKQKKKQKKKNKKNMSK